MGALTGGPQAMSRTKRKSSRLEPWGEVLFHPLSWSRWVRRTALLTAPLSLPLWIVAACLYAIAQIVRLSVTPFAAFWNSPRRRYGGYGQYSYGRGSRGGGSRSAARRNPARGLGKLARGEPAEAVEGDVLVARRHHETVAE